MDSISGNLGYEYIALHRPVIASRLESVAAYFPGDALWFFEPGDDADLAETLRHAHTHAKQSHRRVAVATTIYERFRWEREKHVYLAVYGASDAAAARVLQSR